MRWRASSQQLAFSSEEIQEFPREYFWFSTEEMKNSSEVSFDSSEVSFDSSEEIFLASVMDFHFPPSYREILRESRRNQRASGRLELTYSPLYASSSAPWSTLQVVRLFRLFRYTPHPLFALVFCHVCPRRGGSLSRLPLFPRYLLPLAALDAIKT